MRKLLALVLAILMLTAIVPMASAELDTTEQVEVIAYMMGDKPVGYDKVMEKVNEILLDKLNCTLTINFIGWADWGTAYNLLLTGNEPIDLIYSAAWASDKTYARKGAFMDLSDIVEEVAPTLWEMIPSEAWDYAVVDGMIYCIPTALVTYTGGGIIYREDLRKKYDLPIPDSIENMTIYQQGIKDNCPEMYANLDGGEVSHEVMRLDNFNLAMNNDTGMVIGSTQSAEEKASYAKYEKYISMDNEQFLEELRVAKEWADKGFWDKNLSSNPNDDVNGFFEQGMVALTYNGQNIDKWTGIYTRALENHPDWEVGFVPYGLKQGYAFISSPTQDATAVPITSKNPEHAIAVVQEIYTNADLFHLISYGIEGEHYTVNENGAYVAMDKASEFGTFAMNTWGWKNEELMLEGKSETSQQRDDMVAKLEAVEQVMPSQFSFDVSPVETEAASLKQVITQYLTPLRYGLTDDLDADLKTFFEKAEAAGLSKVQDEWIKQYEAYLAEQTAE